MRIGPLEFRWYTARHRSGNPPITDRDLTGVFAVPNDEPWWIAVHSLINQAEAETIKGARAAHTRNPNGCVAAIGASEGVDLVRQKLIDARELALRTGGENYAQRNQGRESVSSPA